MNIQITNVTTRTEYVATTETMRLTGSYKTNQQGVLTDISGTAYSVNNAADVKGIVEGHLNGNSLRYNYTNVTDADIDDLRDLAIGVVNSVVNASQEGGDE